MQAEMEKLFSESREADPPRVVYHTAYDSGRREIVGEMIDKKGGVWYVVRDEADKQFDLRKEWVEAWIASGFWLPEMMPA
jgi:hypothetical protein